MLFSFSRKKLTFQSSGVLHAVALRGNVSRNQTSETQASRGLTCSRKSMTAWSNDAQAHVKKDVELFSVRRALHSPPSCWCPHRRTLAQEIESEGVEITQSTDLDLVTEPRTRSGKVNRSPKIPPSTQKAKYRAMRTAQALRRWQMARVEQRPRAKKIDTPIA